MPSIRVLDSSISELIAAGEVIERPSSVIKELVENSIDAGATVITVDIKGGGIRSMRVTDNGCGIAPNQLATAFLRHATSKVTARDDIYSISTLGFRGEALASISAVSRVNIVSRQKDSDVAYQLSLEAGTPGEVDACAGTEGTTIEVSDLFYNVPARLKFMKKDSTEGNAIATLLDRLALTHPEISFRLVREGVKKLKTIGDGSLKSAIYSVYGRELTRDLVPVELDDGDICVSGFVGKPEVAKSTRTLEQFYINGRYVKCNTAVAALEQAFSGSIMQGKYPVSFIDIRMPCEDIDVNVHPAKLEVKLTNEKQVYSVVYRAVKGAISELEQPVSIDGRVLSQYQPKVNTFTLLNYIPTGTQGRFNSALSTVEKLCEHDDSRHTAGVPSVKYGPTIRDTSYKADVARELSYKLLQSTEGTATTAKPKPSFRDELFANVGTEKNPGDDNISENLDSADILQMAEDSSLSTSTVTACMELQQNIHINEVQNKISKDMHTCITRENLLQYEYIGEIFGTYIIAKYGDSMVLVDKHAAHERLLYNTLVENYTNGAVPEQVLLIPQNITLPHNLHSVAIENSDILLDLGFEVELFGADNILVRTMPSVLDVGDLEPELVNICKILAVGGSADMTGKANSILESVACRAAIKGNDFTDIDEKIELLRQLERTPSVRHCPHGRPVVLELTKREIEKLFGRLG